MDSALNQEIAEFLSSQNLGKLVSMQAVSGGSINDAFRLKTSTGTYFLKVNSADAFPKMFEAELKGLELLAHSTFKIPNPIATCVSGYQQFLLLEWVEQGSPKSEFWETFGTCLAELHSISNPRFGLDHDNYIGSLPQRNSLRKSWAEFYRDERLIPQLKLAEKQGRLSKTMKAGFEGFFQELKDLFPIENPSLLHGDLWSGNMMVATDSSPCIFDPAVYYGHREMDLAMMALFGGFGEDWVDTYNEVYPLETGWRARIEIWQLYPLIVHVNLFGGGYARTVETILQKFI